MERTLRPVETSIYLAAAICFVVAIDKWMNVGAVDWLIDLCLTDPEAPMPDIPELFVETHHTGHAFLWLTIGAALMLVATSYENIKQHVTRRSKPQIHRKRLVAALVHVAHSAGEVKQSVIDDAFFRATGENLGPNEASSAYRSCFRKGAPSLAAILGGVENGEERREIVLGTIEVWFAAGMDSEKATETINNVMAALGLTDDEVATYLEPTPPSLSHSVLGQVRRITASMFSPLPA